MITVLVIAAVVYLAFHIGAGHTHSRAPTRYGLGSQTDTRSRRPQVRASYKCAVNKPIR